ncbi:MAG: cell wall hydrolase [Bacilli bacterium]|jgi:N-acetylmuramoyl-L-alanine amidase|nr:cell wall hydrolase [Bacilli bacterium]
MTVVAHTTKDIDLLARLMRAEAVGEGNLGMLMVGNVGINRIVGNCLDFINIRTISEMLYQTPGGFTGKDSPLFFGYSTSLEKRLAERVIRGETFHPSTHALWFYAPATGEQCRSFWFNQRNSGRYKSHCFYVPAPGACPELY